MNSVELKNEICKDGEEARTKSQFHLKLFSTTRNILSKQNLPIKPRRMEVHNHINQSIKFSKVSMKIKVSIKIVKNQTKNP